MTTELREVRRRRGWTQDQLQHEMRRSAARLGLTLPGGQQSLRVMISSWENARHTPSADHVLVLCAAYDVPADALGLTAAPEPEPDEAPVRSLLRRRTANAGPEVADYFTRQMTEHARMDNLTGPLFVVDTVLTQFEQLVALPGREPKRAASRYAELAGWLLHDSGETEKALTYTDRSVQLADAAGDDALAVYNLMRKGNVLYALDRVDEAAAVARRAVALAQVHAPDQLAVCLRQEALTSARRGDEAATRQMFERAVELTAPTLTGDEFSSYCTTGYLHMEAALCWLTLRRPADAVQACTAALTRWPTELVRDEALCRTRLAVAHLQLRQIDEAREATSTALDRARTAPSARTLHMLQLIATRLAPYRQDRRIRDLAREIAEVA
ncbi:helix-turn-helix domain-containing protein [Actinomycetospora straminea]|uniref:HTH cro/C1-type domain-containing protein n=1 Tax=Actinomycetospora straminea TaxID=663607 RepID=A0ABP9DXW7_9PSEU|nr:helix-turn-helix transcriptional regulator [Actinomycetospora straminea]MDD7934188.1 helix-turn-helix transcriptional regulator [Actinomycetospora straminea]